MTLLPAIATLASVAGKSGQGPSLASLASLAGIRLGSLSGSDIIRVGEQFNVPIAEDMAQVLARTIPGFVADPEGTLGDFVMSGAWLRMLANKPPPSLGDTIIRCPHCDDLIFLQSSKE